MEWIEREDEYCAVCDDTIEYTLVGEEPMYCEICRNGPLCHEHAVQEDGVVLCPDCSFMMGW